MIIIIAFSTRTSKLMPRLFCRHFKHCAPIIFNKNKGFILLQFITTKKIIPINLSQRDLSVLESFGWRFVYLGNIKKYKPKHPFTCVQFTKQVIGMKKVFIQTPDSLYKSFL